MTFMNLTPLCYLTRYTMLQHSFNNPYVPGTHFYFRLFLQFSSFYVFRLIRPLPQSFQEDHNRL